MKLTGRLIRMTKLSLFIWSTILLAGIGYAQAERPSSSQPSSQVKTERSTSAADSVPSGQDLVSIDFPEPTDIKDIIRAVALWTGKNVILGKGVAGKVQMISPRKVTKEEAYQAFLSALEVTGLTTVETGKVIKVMPTRNALKDNLSIYQGTTWAPRTDKLITQIVPLKYIDAKKVQTTLSRIVSLNSMIAYQPTNTLIISDTGFKVRRILEIIGLLDVAGQQPQVVLVPIRYGDAKNIAAKVSDILKSGGGVASSAKGWCWQSRLSDLQDHRRREVELSCSFWSSAHDRRRKRAYQKVRLSG
jgi:general secretion pathway protein D